MSESFDNNVGYAVKSVDLYTRFKGTSGSAGAFIGELPETIELVLSLIRIANTVLSPGRWPRKLYQLKKALGSAYLYNEFGLKPLISDLQTIYSTVQRHNAGQIRPPVASQLDYHEGPFSSLLPIWHADENECVMFEMMGGSYPLPSFNTRHTSLVGAGQVIGGYGGLSFPTPSKDVNIYFTPLRYDRRKVYVSEASYRKWSEREGIPDWVDPKLRLLFDELGFHNSMDPTDTRVIQEVALTVLELFPYSWLIEYFIDLSGLLGKTIVPDSALFKAAQISSVRFHGYELGISIGQNLDKGTQDSGPEGRHFIPLAHYGVREFRRTDSIITDWDHELQSTGDIKIPTVGQLANIAALLLAKL